MLLNYYCIIITYCTLLILLKNSEQQLKMFNWISKSKIDLEGQVKDIQAHISLNLTTTSPVWGSLRDRILGTFSCSIFLAFLFFLQMS